MLFPNKVTEAHTTASTVTLELPPELIARRVHPTFHMSLLRAHVPNDDARFCYDLIRLRLGPVPEPCPAQSDPRVFQPSCVM